MKEEIVYSKSSLVKSKIAEYTINPYLGCMCGCRYCYASMIMQRFHHKNDIWGEFIDIRINTPENVQRELKNKRSADIYISSMTDCYQPLEEKYKITRRTLINILSLENSLFGNKFSVTIQTKSSLILRDVDILTQFKNLTVGFTITTLDEGISRIFEPKASVPSERLRALSILNKHSIKTYAFFGPILPTISDSSEQLISIIKAIQETGVKEIIFDKLNYFPFVKGLKELANELGLVDAFSKADDPEYVQTLKKRILDLKEQFKEINFGIVF